jgi:hypothetical protein
MIDKLDARAARTGQLRCWMCARPLHATAWHLDHVRPLAAAGRHHIDNLEPACVRCNLVKGDSWDELWAPPIDDFKPLWTRLRSRPAEDVWSENPELAKRALTVPRPVPVDPDIGEFAKSDLVVAILQSQPDPFRAMKLGAISSEAPTLGRRIGVGELDREWLKLLGMSRVHGNRPTRTRPFHDRRMPAHPLVIATRVRERDGAWGVRAFRLRPPPISVAVQIDPLSLERLARFVDHDE